MVDYTYRGVLCTCEQCQNLGYNGGSPVEEGQEEAEGDKAQHHTQDHEHCRRLEILLDCGCGCVCVCVDVCVWVGGWVLMCGCVWMCGCVCCVLVMITLLRLIAQKKVNCKG